MKKTRVKLSEKYPKYFAAAGIPEAEDIAEVTDTQMARLDSLEAALPDAEKAPEEHTQAQEQEQAPAAAAPTQESQAQEEAPAAQAAVSFKDSEEFQAMQKRIGDLEAKFEDSPAVLHTAIGDDASAEGQTGKQENKYACSVDAELDAFTK